MADKHTHKLRRHTYKSGNTTFFCALPDCSYKISPPLAIGKRSICWRCGDPFILNEYSVRLAKPHCEKCHKPKGEQKELPMDAKLPQLEDLKDFKPTTSPALLSLKDRLAKAIHAADPTAEDGEI